MSIKPLTDLLKEGKPGDVVLFHFEDRTYRPGVFASMQGSMHGSSFSGLNEILWADSSSQINDCKSLGELHKMPLSGYTPLYPGVRCVGYEMLKSTTDIGQQAPLAPSSPSFTEREEEDIWDKPPTPEMVEDITKA